MLQCNNIKKHNDNKPYVWEYKGINLISGQCYKCKNQVSIKFNTVKVQNETN